MNCSLAFRKCSGGCKAQFLAGSPDLPQLLVEAENIQDLMQ